MTLLAPEFDALRRTQPIRVSGRVVSFRGLSLLAEDLPLPVGSLVSVRPAAATDHDAAIPGEIVGFSREHAAVMLLGSADSIRPGDRIVGEQVSPTIPVGHALLGRCIDGLGRPIDGLGPIRGLTHRPLNPDPIPALRRARVDRPIRTGVRAIDLTATVGRGQRLGVFAGPGVGKSTLLGMIARGTSADVNVIALVGERGREVRDFLHDALGAAGLARSVVVVATGDESPLLRLRAAKAACAAAEFFRDAGQDVMLMMDSVTRFAHAQRQVGLSVGEPPATKGYTPSVFAQLAMLLERAGAVEAAPDGHARAGSITALYTILVEGDDLTEPVSDAVRGILDGHVVLSRALAQRSQFPAVDVLDSVSRVADQVSDPAHADARRRIRRLLALHRGVEDLVQIGAYARGVNPETDAAIDLHPAIMELLRQRTDEHAAFDEARAALIKLASRADDMVRAASKARGGKAA